MKKVLVLTYYWPPSGGAGVQRILKFVKYFPKFNIKPFIVTVAPDKASYPSNDDTLDKDIPDEAVVFRTNTFEPYEIYSKLLGRKSIPTGFSNESEPTAFQKFSRFIRGNFFIPDARKGWIKYAVRKSCEIIEKEKIDILISTSPPHSVQLAALMLKRKYNLKWIADLRDPWTDIYYYNEFRHLSFAKKKDLYLEKSVLENADKIITVSEPIKKLLSGKSDKINESKIIVIPNGYDDDDFTHAKNKTTEEFIISYTGTIAESYEPNVFFESLNSVVTKFPEINFKMRLIGSPASTVNSFFKEKNMEGILEVIPTVSHEKSIEYLFESTVLLLVIPRVQNDKGILTGKLFEYLASGKPIICIGPADGEAAKIIDECKAGKTFERTMKNRLIQYLEYIISEWKEKKNINQEVLSHQKYSRLYQTKVLSQVILDI